MKLSSLKEAAKLMEQLADLESKIKTLRTGSVVVRIDPYDIVLTNEAAEGLRSRILQSTILDFEKINERLVELGVDL